MKLKIDNKQFTLNVEAAVRMGILKEDFIVDVSKIVAGSIWTSEKGRGIILSIICDENGDDNMFILLCAEAGWLMKTFACPELCKPITRQSVIEYFTKKEYKFLRHMSSLV